MAVSLLKVLEALEAQKKQIQNTSLLTKLDLSITALEELKRVHPTPPVVAADSAPAERADAAGAQPAKDAKVDWDALFNPSVDNVPELLNRDALLTAVETNLKALSAENRKVAPGIFASWFRWTAAKNFLDVRTIRIQTKYEILPTYRYHQAQQKVKACDNLVAAIERADTSHTVDISKQQGELATLKTELQKITATSQKIPKGFLSRLFGYKQQQDANLAKRIEVNTRLSTLLGQLKQAYDSIAAPTAAVASSAAPSEAEAAERQADLREADEITAKQTAILEPLTQVQSGNFETEIGTPEYPLANVTTASAQLSADLARLFSLTPRDNNKGAHGEAIGQVIAAVTQLHDFYKQNYATISDAQRNACEALLTKCAEILIGKNDQLANEINTSLISIPDALAESKGISAKQIAILSTLAGVRSSTFSNDIAASDYPLANVPAASEQLEEDLKYLFSLTPNLNNRDAHEQAKEQVVAAVTEVIGFYKDKYATLSEAQNKACHELLAKCVTVLQENGYAQQFVETITATLSSVSADLAELKDIATRQTAIGKLLAQAQSKSFDADVTPQLRHPLADVATACAELETDLTHLFSLVPLTDTEQAHTAAKAKVIIAVARLYAYYKENWAVISEAQRNACHELLTKCATVLETNGNYAAFVGQIRETLNSIPADLAELQVIKAKQAALETLLSGAQSETFATDIETATHPLANVSAASAQLEADLKSLFSPEAPRANNQQAYETARTKVIAAVGKLHDYYKQNFASLSSTQDVACQELLAKCVAILTPIMVHQAFALKINGTLASTLTSRELDLEKAANLSLDEITAAQSKLLPAIEAYVSLKNGPSAARQVELVQRSAVNLAQLITTHKELLATKLPAIIDLNFQAAETSGRLGAFNQRRNVLIKQLFNEYKTRFFDLTVEQRTEFRTLLSSLFTLNATTGVITIEEFDNLNKDLDYLLKFQEFVAKITTQREGNPYQLIDALLVDERISIIFDALKSSDQVVISKANQILKGLYQTYLQDYQALTRETTGTPYISRLEALKLDCYEVLLGRVVALYPALDTSTQVTKLIESRRSERLEKVGQNLQALTKALKNAAERKDQRREHVLADITRVIKMDIWNNMHPLFVSQQTEFSDAVFASLHQEFKAFYQYYLDNYENLTPAEVVYYENVLSTLAGIVEVYKPAHDIAAFATTVKATLIQKTANKKSLDSARDSLSSEVIGLMDVLGPRIRGSDVAGIPIKTDFAFITGALKTRSALATRAELAETVCALQGNGLLGQRKRLPTFSNMASSVAREFALVPQSKGEGEGAAPSSDQSILGRLLTLRTEFNNAVRVFEASVLSQPGEVGSLPTRLSKNDSLTPKQLQLLNSVIEKQEDYMNSMANALNSLASYYIVILTEAARPGKDPNALSAAIDQLEAVMSTIKGSYNEVCDSSGHYKQAQTNAARTAPRPQPLQQKGLPNQPTTAAAKLAMTS